MVHSLYDYPACIPLKSRFDFQFIYQWKKLSLFSWQSHIDFLFLLLMVLENNLKFLSVALRMCLHCAWCFDIFENKLCCLFTYHLLVCREGIRYDLPDSQWVCLHLPTAPFWSLLACAIPSSPRPWCNMADPWKMPHCEDECVHITPHRTDVYETCISHIFFKKKISYFCWKRKKKDMEYSVWIATTHPLFQLTNDKFWSQLAWKTWKLFCKLDVLDFVNTNKTLVSRNIFSIYLLSVLCNDLCRVLQFNKPA